MNSQQSTTTPQNPDVRRTFRVTIEALFKEPRLWSIYVLGISSGYPQLVIGTCLTYSLQAAGFSRTTIGFLGAVGAAYAFNFAWAPVVDHFRIPLLSLLGHRKSWLIVCIATMIVCTLGMMGCITAIHLTGSPLYVFLLALCAVIIAFASATQDIVTAAYRITSIRKDEPHLVGLAAAMETAGWTTGFGIPGFLVLLTAGSIGWSFAYLELTLFFIPLLLFVIFVLKEPPEAEYERSPFQGIGGVLYTVVILRILGPIIEFVKRNGFLLAVVLIVFLLSFKLGEGFLGKMSAIFYTEVGFTYKQVGINTKLIGTFVTVISAFIAGIFVGRFKAIPMLVVGGITMSATNLLFFWMALLGPKNWLYLLTVVADGFTTGFSSVAFVVLITHFTSRLHAGTQYAAMSSIGTSGRHIVAAFSGLLVDSMDGNWALFFVLTAVWIIPVLFILYVLTLLVNRRENKGVQVKTYEE